MATCEGISFLSNFFSTLSLLSWICAQLPQIYSNYRTKSAEGISPSFLLLWFMGDFLSFTSCLLNDVVLKFQVYLSLFFICNDITLCYQYYYYNSVYPKKYGTVSETTDSRGPGYEYLPTQDAELNARMSESIQIHRSNTDKGGPITEYLSSLGSPGGSYNSFDSQPARSKKKAPAGALALGAAALNVSIANAFPITNAASSEVSAAWSLFSRETLGFVLAWSCTIVYVSSRCPQLYKNYKRKSVEGISPLLFGSALLGNLTYTLSIVSSCSFLFADDKSSFIMKELPYILGSSGTIVFDIAYFYQRYIYRFNGRNTLVMELEDELWEGEI